MSIILWEPLSELGGLDSLNFEDMNLERINSVKLNRQ